LPAAASPSALAAEYGNKQITDNEKQEVQKSGQNLQKLTGKDK